MFQWSNPAKEPTTQLELLHGPRLTAMEGMDMQNMRAKSGETIRSFRLPKKSMEDQMKITVISAAILAVLAGCAQQPASIAPVSMADTYSHISCSQAKQLYLKESAKVPTLVAAQKNAVAGDAIGVFLIGIPVSSLSGADLEGEIAATKGKLIALAGRLEACGTSPAEVAWG